MTAGRGIRHSEFNPSATEPVHLYQIWLLPRESGLPPSYDQKTFLPADRAGRWQLVASPDGADSSLKIEQDARIYLADFGMLSLTGAAISGVWIALDPATKAAVLGGGVVAGLTSYVVNAALLIATIGLAACSSFAADGSGGGSDLGLLSDAMRQVRDYAASHAITDVDPVFALHHAPLRGRMQQPHVGPLVRRAGHDGIRVERDQCLAADRSDLPLAVSGRRTISAGLFDGSRIVGQSFVAHADRSRAATVRSLQRPHRHVQQLSSSC